MEIFAENPRSFRMDRKSPEASKLKASVSEKLFEFLGSYSDDVLAEYIVVLVCNGKHQYQARVDLEAFLGDESGNFVAWLWGLLLKTVNVSRIPSSMVNIKEVNIKNCHDDDLDREQKFRRAGILDKPLSMEEQQRMLFTLSTKQISSDTDDASEDYQRWCPGHASLTEQNIEEVHEYASQNEISGKRTSNCKVAMEHGPSRDRCLDGISAGGEQCLHFENQYKKIVNGSDSDSPLLLHSSKMRSMQSAFTENSHLKPVSVTNAVTGSSLSAADAAFHHDTGRRGNVWDRLGRPRDDNNVSTADRIYPSDIDIIRRKKLEHGREGCETQRLRLLVPDGGKTRKLVRETAVLDNNSGELVSNEFTRPDHGANTVHKLSTACMFRRKRQHSEINATDSLSDSKDGHHQAKILLRGLQRSQSVKDGQSQELNGVTSDCQSSDGHFSEPSRHLPRSPNTALNPATSGKSQGQLDGVASLDIAQTPVSVNSSLLAKSESLKHAGSWQITYKPVQDEVLDMKLKLQQIEMEMTKLRSKQSEISIDGCTQKHSEEDIESRTVFVRNVHFAATKEALSSHFSKCGAVLKTTLLRDAVTGQPKGSAYVAFATKSSADKAIAMSGTSFFSRTLKVVKKADALSESSLSAQPTGKPSQPWHPSSPLTKKGSLQRPYCGTHLQWRRGQTTDIESSASTVAGKTQGSNNGGQGKGCQPVTSNLHSDATA